MVSIVKRGGVRSRAGHDRRQKQKPAVSRHHIPDRVGQAEQPQRIDDVDGDPEQDGPCLRLLVADFDRRFALGEIDGSNGTASGPPHRVPAGNNRVDQVCDGPVLFRFDV